MVVIFVRWIIYLVRDGSLLVVIWKQVEGSHYSGTPYQSPQIMTIYYDDIINRHSAGSGGGEGGGAVKGFQILLFIYASSCHCTCVDNLILPP